MPEVKNESQVKMLGVRLPVETHRRFMSQLALRDLTAQEVVREFIEQWLKRNG